MTAPTYASTTQVPVERSRFELDTLLAKHGATHRVIADLPGAAGVAFVLAGQPYTVRAPMPTVDNPGEVPDHWALLSETNKRIFLQQQTKARWRSLVLLVKAKLEAIRIGVTTAAQEFPRPQELPSGAPVGLLSSSTQGNT